MGLNKFGWRKQTYLEPYMAGTKYYFKVYRILRQEHLKQVGLKQNCETMTFP